VSDLLLPIAALLPHSIGPYIALVLIGFAIGILGHLSSSRPLVLAGVILIFLGAFLFPVALNVTTETPPQVEKSPSP
jgi:F0F1-type ATP synthase assembly protein I